MNCFVAVGNDGIFTSSNGTGWSQRSSDITTKITYGNNLFVAAGGTTIFTSSDGITWIARYSNVASWNDITYGNNLYVAVGSPTTIATSPDGYNWTKQTNPDSIPTLLKVFYNTLNNMFAIIGEGKIYNCGIFNMMEIQIIEIDKRLSRVQPDYVDY